MASSSMAESRGIQIAAIRYTQAWCSQKPTAVAAHFAPEGSLIINNGIPSIGREAIAETVQSFMTAFPDLRVIMDRLVPVGEKVEYHWTLTGTNTGPGGTGRRVRISGYESWLMDADCLILASQGHFDADDHKRQLAADDSL
jgi:hypothetical protein